ncbi:MAG: hypothetical protein WDN31_11355 [Hyphomicrobium sp.]
MLGIQEGPNFGWSSFATIGSIIGGLVVLGLALLAAVAIGQSAGRHPPDRVSPVWAATCWCWRWCSSRCWE